MHKKLIDGLLYDTTKSQLIAERVDSGRRELGRYKVTYSFYKTPNGRFFEVRNANGEIRFFPRHKDSLRNDFEGPKIELFVPYEEIFGPIKEA